MASLGEETLNFINDLIVLSFMKEIVAKVNSLTARLGRAPRILLVDDERAIVDSFRDGFEMLGYTAHSEMCTYRAARKILEDATLYDVVLADYNNKGASGDIIGGLTLHRTLSEGSSLPALYILISAQNGFPVPEQVPFMQKPFGIVEVVGFVTEKLEERTRSAGSTLREAVAYTYSK